MAEATLTRVLGIGPWKDGPYARAILDWTGGGTYPTGGYTIDPKPLIGARTILGVKKIGGNAAAALYNIHWDTVNQKMLIIYPTGGAGAAPSSLADPAQGAMTIDDHAADQVGTIPAGATPVTSTAANGAIITAGNITAADSHVVSAVGSGTPGRGKELKASTDDSSLQFRLEFIAA